MPWSGGRLMDFFISCNAKFWPSRFKWGGIIHPTSVAELLALLVLVAIAWVIVIATVILI